MSRCARYATARWRPHTHTHAHHLQMIAQLDSQSSSSRHSSKLTMSSCGCASENEATEAQLSNSIKWRIRPMQLEDIDECLVIWRQVELTEARQTVASSLVTDPNGFYVAELDNGDDDDGEFI